MIKIKFFKYLYIMSITTIGISPYAIADDVSDKVLTESSKERVAKPGSPLSKSDDYSLKTLEWLREIGKKQVGEASYKMAIYSMQQKDWGKAKNLIYEAVEMEPNNQNYLNTAVYIAYNQHDYKMAEVFLLKVLSTQKDTLKVNPLKHAMLLDNLALIYQKQNRFNDARKIIQKSLSIHEANADNQYPNLISRLYRMADLNVQLGDFGDAVLQMKQTIQLLEKNHNDSSEQEIAKAYHNIGDIYTIQNYFGEAQTAYLKALELWKENTQQGRFGKNLTLKKLSLVKTKLKYQNNRIIMSAIE